MSRQDIERSGVQSVMELVDRLSAAQSIGNFNNTLGEGSSLVGFNGISLRGLGTQRSLVLIDGKRTAPYALSNTSSPSAAGVDLNAIPISAIERVELLKDGASALYGSDAIGGVINFILRKDFRGAEASFTLLDTEHGGGGSKRYNAIVGAGDLAKDRYNFFITADYLDQANLRAADREISKTAYLPQFGFDRTSGNSLPANISQSSADFFPGLAVPVRLRERDRRHTAEHAEQRHRQGDLPNRSRSPGVHRRVVVQGRFRAGHLADADRLGYHQFQRPPRPPEQSVLPESVCGQPGWRPDAADRRQLSGRRNRPADGRGR
jgi:outer membrane receptor protein involved in Fe transport